MNILAKMQGGGADGRVFVADGNIRHLIVETCVGENMLMKSEEYLRSSLENFNNRAGMLEVVFCRTAREAEVREYNDSDGVLPEWVKEAIVRGFEEQCDEVTIRGAKE